MNSTTVSTTTTASDYVQYVADRCASREADALTDFYGLGRMVATGEVNYDEARDMLAAAFQARGLKASTAKVYLSQGAALGDLFETFEDVETFADDECDGSRSLKRIYDATRTPVAKAEPTPVVDVIIGLLAQVSDQAELGRIADALNARIGATVKLAA